MPLTKKQQNTYDLLITGNFDKVQLRDVTSLINSLFNAVTKTPEQEQESKQQKRDAIKGSIKYMAEQPKHKDKSKDELNKEIVNKIKKTSKGEKSTKELRNEEREIYSDVSSEISLSSDDDDQEEKKYDDEGQPIKLGDKKAAAAAEAEATRQAEAARLATARQVEGQNIQLRPQEVAELYRKAEANQADLDREELEQMSLGDRLSKYIDFGSDYYSKNKKTIDKVLGAFTEKKIKDGSYLTELASLEVPEIAIFQQIVKDIGLGFTKQDKEDFEKMLSTNRDIANSVSMEDSLRLALKMLINPDQVGVLVRTRGEQVVDDIKDWWAKVKGQKRLKPDEEALKEKIERRRKDIEKQKNKNKEIDEWFGIKEEEKKAEEPSAAINPYKPIHGGGGIISGGGAVYDPDLIDRAVDIDNLPEVDWSDKDAMDLLFPPSPDGFKDSTAGEDFMGWLSEFFSLGGVKRPRKGQKLEQYLEELQREDPDAYDRYIKEKAKYEQKIGKASLERDGKVDYEKSKSYIENSKQLTKELLQKAVESGKLTREMTEKIYDEWDMFNQIESGDVELTYAQLETLQSKLIDTIPKDVLRENSDMVNKFMEDNIDYIKSGWEGDSDLGNFDWLADKLAEGQGGETDGFDPKTGKPAEKKIQPKQKPQAEARYRYRGRWGNEDEIFKRTDEEIDRRNLIIEVQRLREDINTTNKLIQSRIKTEQMRFDRTFSMPPPPDSTIKPLPNKFLQNHRAIFQPAVIQNSIRPFEQNSRDEAYYGQYQAWQPTIPESTSRRELLTNQLIFPSVTDLATGGEQKEIAPPSQFNWIENQRFTNAY